MYQPEINTGRLILRRFKPSDASSVKELAGNKKVAKTTMNIPHPYPEGMAENWIKAHAEWWESKTRVVFAITTKEKGQLIGAVSLIKIDGDQAEIGYWIGEPYWGNGFCTEAVIALIQYSNENLGINKFTAEHLESNSASGKVLLKAGLLHVKTVQKNDRFGEKASVKIYESKNT